MGTLRRVPFFDFIINGLTAKVSTLVGVIGNILNVLGSLPVNLRNLTFFSPG